MGARQSKRSVDISGKETEGEVIGGGEGKLEPIADVDNIKPQPNGDAAHDENPTPTETAKTDTEEKPVENGITEKNDDAEVKKEIVVNGDKNEAQNPQQPEENGDTHTEIDTENKKTKKDKVKKKWSFRSISFSRKDKPKHEKKSKEDEAKTNGDVEKVPEEGAEGDLPTSEIKPVEDIPEATIANSNEQTPDTPVTEPITNGDVQETPKEVELKTEVKAAEEKIQSETPVQANCFETCNENKDHISLSTEKCELIEQVSAVESRAPEVATTIEVCVEKSSQEESSPPPLPDNPPPSSVTAFAETTMAQHLVETPSSKESSNQSPSQLSESKPSTHVVSNALGDGNTDEILSNNKTSELSAHTEENESASEMTKQIKTVNDETAEEVETPSTVITEETETTAKVKPPSMVITEEVIEIKDVTTIVNDSSMEDVIIKEVEQVKENDKPAEVDENVNECESITMNGEKNVEETETNETEECVNDNNISNGVNSHEEEINDQEDVDIQKMKKEATEELDNLTITRNGNVIKNGINGDEELDSFKEDESIKSVSSLPPPPPELCAPAQESIPAVADKLAELSLPDDVPELPADDTVTASSEAVSPEH